MNSTPLATGCHSLPVPGRHQAQSGTNLPKLCKGETGQNKRKSGDFAKAARMASKDS